VSTEGRIRELAEEILGLVSRRFSVRASLVTGKSRTQPAVDARFVYAWVLRELGLTLERIGEIMNRHHSSVLAAVRKVKDRYLADPSAKTDLDAIMKDARAIAAGFDVSTAIRQDATPKKEAAPAPACEPAPEPTPDPAPEKPRPPQERPKVRPSIRKPRERGDGFLTELPGARLVLVTTPQVVEVLQGLVMTGLFGRDLDEAAERVLCRGLEEVAHFAIKPKPGASPRPYHCRLCDHRWLAAFSEPPDALVEYSIECPACGQCAGEPFEGDGDPA